jgi:hypothetical protein
MNMKALLLFLVVSLGTVSAWARPNILELLKAGKSEYQLNSNCQRFLHQVNPAVFQYDKINSWTVLLKDHKKENDFYFYHYTDNNVTVQLTHEKNYKNLIQTQILSTSGLGNQVGPGLYIAENPNSSRAYGHNQIKLRLDPDAKIFYWHGYELSQFLEKIPGIDSCPTRAMKVLILNENQIDLIFYDGNLEWFSLINEDIILSSSNLP